MSVQSSMTAIANKIRAIRGISGTMGLGAMATNLSTVQTDLSNAFTAVGNKKGTVPSSKVSGNLATAINSIPAGVELNYKVVGGTSAPASPSQNTIWVNTSTAISSHVFSAAQPTGASGMVWIRTATSGSVVFNALKQNTINVYPLFARQYVSGAWKNVTAKIYQNGWAAWWSGELYKNGNEYSVYSGGWIGLAKKSSSSSSVGSAVPSITRNASDITLEAGGSNGGGGVFHTGHRVDLTGFTKLTFTGEFKRAGADNNLVFACWPDLEETYYTSGYSVLQKTASTATVTSIELDISTVNSEQYIGIGIVGDSTAKITSIVLS